MFLYAKFARANTDRYYTLLCFRMGQCVKLIPAANCETDPRDFNSMHLFFSKSKPTPHSKPTYDLRSNTVRILERLFSRIRLSVGLDRPADQPIDRTLADITTTSNFEPLFEFPSQPFHFMKQSSQSCVCLSCSITQTLDSRASLFLTCKEY